MRGTFKIRKPTYDLAAIAQMTKTMSRRQIIQSTGISRSYLSQVLCAAGSRGAAAEPQARALSLSRTASTS